MRHAFLLVYDPVARVALRVESVSCRLDIQPMPVDEMTSAVEMFFQLGWPMVRREIQWRMGERWLPGLLTCVGVVKRVVGGIPWWVWTPTQLYRHLDNERGATWLAEAHSG